MYLSGELGIPEKRDSPRLPWSAEIHFVLSAAYELAEQSQPTLRGEAENIAAGGIGMLCGQYLPPGTVVRGKVALSQPQAYIPTLLAVRWTQQCEDQKRYRVGLQFLV